MKDFVDPLTSLSDNFRLLDFLGCETVYRTGVENLLGGNAEDVDYKLRNALVLCDEMLEPALQHFGGMSIAYGYISPELSRKIVKYQDPDKPSHHRWDLGAAADIILHEHVQQEGNDGAPIHAAHEINALRYGYSRIITYSESPCICVAVSADEIANGKPRKAFYENRYEGTPKVKPLYIQMPSEQRRGTELARLTLDGLPADWRGAGYPTHHGGGYCQNHHIRVSRHTMLSDWLKHSEYMPYGNRMAPPRSLPPALQDRFAAAGIIYDSLIEWVGPRRFTITAGYLPPAIENEIDCKVPWHGEQGAFSFRIARPGNYAIDDLANRVEQTVEGFGQVEEWDGGEELLIVINDMEEVLNEYAKDKHPSSA